VSVHDADLADAAAALLEPGGVILYPTETVYGLGGRASDSAAARRVAGIKGRTLLPLIVLVDGIPDGLSPPAAALARALWPGPVTLIVPAETVSLPGGVAPEILGEGGTLALRWSPHPVARSLVAAVGAITSTSANRHGQPPVLDPLSPAAQALPVDARVNGGVSAAGPPSTLVDTRSGAVLREGAALEAVRSALAAAGYRA